MKKLQQKNISDLTLDQRWQKSAEHLPRNLSTSMREVFSAISQQLKTCSSYADIITQRKGDIEAIAKSTSTSDQFELLKTLTKKKIGETKGRNIDSAITSSFYAENASKGSLKQLAADGYLVFCSTLAFICAVSEMITEGKISVDGQTKTR